MSLFHYIGYMQKSANQPIDDMPQATLLGQFTGSNNKIKEQIEAPPYTTKEGNPALKGSPLAEVKGYRYPMAAENKEKVPEQLKTAPLQAKQQVATSFDPNSYAALRKAL